MLEPVIIMTQRPTYSVIPIVSTPKTSTENIEDPGLQLSLAHITGQLSDMSVTSIITTSTDKAPGETLLDNVNFEKVETVTPKSTVSFDVISDNKEQEKNKINNDMIQIVDSLDSSSSETLPGARSNESPQSSGAFNDYEGLASIEESLSHTLGLRDGKKKGIRQTNNVNNERKNKDDDYDILGLEAWSETLRKNVTYEDGPYEVVNFTIPLSIWKKAWSIKTRLPAFKSQATVVLPIQVNYENDTENDLYDEETEDTESQTENPIQDTVVSSDNPQGSSTQSSITSEVLSTSTTPIPISTSQQIQEDYEPTTEQDVAGQAIRLPCSCLSGQCGCCTRFLFPRLDMMNTCGNITFIPEDFIFDVRMTVNNRTVARRRVSASNPPPICFNPRRAPFIQVCAEISNIRIRNNNAFACLDIAANIAGFTVYTASFRCFGFGTAGVQTGLRPKPVQSGGPAPINLFGGNNDDNNNNGLFGGLLGGGAGNGLFGGIGPIRPGGINIISKDAPYDVINFKIPSSIWKKAWSDQPIAAFKSQATVVLPIYISEDYADPESELEENEDGEIEIQDGSEVVDDSEIDDNTEIEQTTELNNNTVEDSTVQDEVTPLLNATTPLPETTTQIVEDEEPSNTTDVPGQGIRQPCACSRRQCGCCTRMILPRLNMNTCGNVTFIPRDFLFDVRMTINNRTVLRRRVSGTFSSSHSTGCSERGPRIVTGCFTRQAPVYLLSSRFTFIWATMCVNSLILAVTIVYSNSFLASLGHPSETLLQNSTQMIKGMEHLEVPDSALILLHRLKYSQTPNANFKTPRKKQQVTPQPQGQEEPSRRCTCADGKNPRPICINPPRLSNLKLRSHKNESLHLLSPPSQDPDLSCLILSYPVLNSDRGPAFDCDSGVDLRRFRLHSRFRF
ncbi:hypothetical protein EVAR_93162_1 [Eumeta japonica]|uniref:DUF4773 domain-containing protein n=1 Tax=Eumeta variegata TaxID=151549 RepID=A0A4C1TI00_EUMVA|nr:hypothetical protein EVAR_93162_1 [Eumeta japonica]